MAFKLVLLATILAYANAGNLISAVPTYAATPLTYSADPVAIHDPHYGASHQSLERSLGGAQSVSHYSKAVDSAFSSVRKFDTRITNDALTLAHAPLVSAYAAPVVTKAVAPVATYAHAAPVYSAYSAPLVAKSVAYSAAPAVSSSYIHQSAAPLSYAAPVATYAAHAPAVTSYTSPVVAKAVSPVATYATHATPILTSYSAPTVAKAVTPLATYGYSTPVAAYAAHAAPLALSSGPLIAKSAVAYSPAAVVAHTTFSGLGTAYQW